MSEKQEELGVAARFSGSNLRARRMERGFKVAQLARKIDPENAKSLAISIHGYEADRNIPSCVMLFLLAKSLKCRMEYFIEEVK